jgi:hypothetical protein
MHHDVTLCATLGGGHAPTRGGSLLELGARRSAGTPERHGEVAEAA